MKIDVDEGIAKEFAYIVELHKNCGADNPQESVESLINYVLLCVAEGSRRPGSREREAIESIGLIANCEEHYEYRARYGKLPTTPG